LGCVHFGRLFHKLIHPVTLSALSQEQKKSGQTFHSKRLSGESIPKSSISISCWYGVRLIKSIFCGHFLQVWKVVIGKLTWHMFWIDYFTCYLLYLLLENLLSSVHLKLKIRIFIKWQTTELQSLNFAGFEPTSVVDVFKNVAKICNCVAHAKTECCIPRCR
jgi:hypothetical protein